MSTTIGELWPWSPGALDRSGAQSKSSSPLCLRRGLSSHWVSLERTVGSGQAKAAVPFPHALELQGTERASRPCPLPNAVPVCAETAIEGGVSPKRLQGSSPRLDNWIVGGAARTRQLLFPNLGMRLLAAC